MSCTFDASYYEEMQGRLRGLLIRLENRLEADQADLIGELIDANEIGVALQVISDLLAERNLEIPPEDADEIARLAERMRLPDVVAAIDDLRRPGAPPGDDGHDMG